MRRAIALAFTCAFLAARAQADVLHVPQDFGTIQAALDAAAAGDEVRIHGGLYEESVTAALPENVTIRGLGSVRVDATGLGDALTLSGQGLQVIGLQVLGGEDGFVVSGQSVLVRSCRVKDVTGRGFVVGGTHVTLRKCRTKDTGGEGVALVASVLGLLENCRVADALGDGLLMDAASSAAYVKSTRVLRAGGDGVVVAGGGALFVHVRVAQAGGRAFVDSAPLIANGNDYVSCRAVEPAADGLVASGQAPTLASLKVTRSGGTGIDITGDFASVKHCRVTAAGGDGLHIAGHQGEWLFNRSQGAAGNGFVLDGTANLLSLNVGQGSAGFDLLDNQPGLNTIEDDNQFGTVGP